MHPNKVFKIEWSGSTLIIVPQGPTLNFHYQDVHLEANSLYRIANDPKVQNIVVDLNRVDVATLRYARGSVICGQRSRVGDVID